MTLWEKERQPVQDYTTKMGVWQRVREEKIKKKVIEGPPDRH